MSYESPIDLITKQVIQQLDDRTFRAIIECGIHVDKEQLIKALIYDRGQYEKGYEDGVNSVNEWIPVSERMPEDSYETDLIVTTGSGMVKLACFTKEDGFVSLTGFHRISEVTAWMKLELPKPYERKEDDKID